MTESGLIKSPPDNLKTQHLKITHVGLGVDAINGKTLRRSFDKASHKAAIHMVSAWASANDLVFAQLATEAKSNEITAIPKLLELLDFKGNTVTIDAMGCQKESARQIVEQGGEYVLALKKNHDTFHDEVFLFLDRVLKRISKAFRRTFTRKPRRIMAP